MGGALRAGEPPKRCAVASRENGRTGTRRIVGVASDLRVLPERVLVTPPRIFFEFRRRREHFFVGALRVLLRRVDFFFDFLDLVVGIYFYVMCRKKQQFFFSCISRKDASRRAPPRARPRRRRAHFCIYRERPEFRRQDIFEVNSASL